LRSGAGIEEYDPIILHANASEYLSGSSPAAPPFYLHNAPACAILEAMPVSLEFIRGIAGFIGIGCAYMMGRSLVLFRQGRERQMRFYAWIFRTVCA